MTPWSELLEEETSKELGQVNEITNLIRVPQIYQADNYGCGAAALQSVLYFYGHEYTYKDLEKALRTSKENGTDHRDVLEFCKTLGLKVELHKAMTSFDLQDFVDQGIPVIIVLQAWGKGGTNLAQSWEDGHYVVCVGYDANNFYFMDPSTLGHYTYIPIEEFITRWHDRDGTIRLVHAGIVITGTKKYNPDEIPKIR